MQEPLQFSSNNNPIYYSQTHANLEEAEELKEEEIGEEG